MKGINVNIRRDFVNAREGRFASSKISTYSSTTTKSYGCKKNENNFTHDNHEDFMSKIASSPRNVFIPTNGLEAINVNNYLENLLM